MALVAGGAAAAGFLGGGGGAAGAGAAAALGPLGWASLGISAIGMGLDIFGASKQESAEKSAYEAAQKEALRQWRFDNKERKRTNKYNIKGWKIDVANLTGQLDYQDEINRRDYQYNLAIRDYEQRQAERLFAQSEQNYKDQLNFNNLAAARAYESETQRMREIEIGQAFDRQDQLVQEARAEGEVRARGQAGRSAAKALQAELAQFGRNMAIMDESLRSAYKQHESNMKDIELQKYGADLQAKAARMLKPERLPEIPEPLAVFRPTIQRPYKLKRRPKPKAPGYQSSGGTFTAAAQGGLSIASSLVSSMNRQYGGNFR